MKRAVETAEAPAAIGPYSQGIIFENLVFTAGQIALKPGTKELNNATIEDETRQVLENLGAVLRAAGSDLRKALRVGIYVTDLAYFQTVNTIYAEYFTGICPARSTVQVAALPLNARVEMDVVAHI
jgi:2-iminobutanoate/2-iminopropanoate deaminase